MKRIKYALLCALASLTIGTLAPTAVSADYCGESFECCPLMIPPCPGDYVFGVDFLWWKPCIDDIDFAGTRTSSSCPNKTSVHFDYDVICPEWRPGVRVTFDYPNLFCWCKIGMNASYTYLDMEQRHTVDGENNVYLLLHPGVASQDVGSNPIYGKWYMKYQAWDTLFYFDYCCCDCLYITPSIGVVGIILDQELKTSAVSFINGEPNTSVLADVKWKSHLTGVGIKSGLNLNYPYSRCLTFYGFANGSIMAARSHTKNQHNFSFMLSEVPVQTELSFKDHNCSRCVPGFHLGVGTQGTFCICGFPVSVRAGYEFLQWYNIPKHRIYTSDNIEDALGRSAFSTRTFGFHGPFAGIVLSF